MVISQDDMIDHITILYDHITILYDPTTILYDHITILHGSYFEGVCLDSRHPDQRARVEGDT